MNLHYLINDAPNIGTERDEDIDFPETGDLFEAYKQGYRGIKQKLRYEGYRYADCVLSNPKGKDVLMGLDIDCSPIMIREEVEKLRGHFPYSNIDIYGNTNTQTITLTLTEKK